MGMSKKTPYVQDNDPTWMARTQGEDVWWARSLISLREAGEQRTDGQGFRGYLYCLRLLDGQRTGYRGSMPFRYRLLEVIPHVPFFTGWRCEDSSAEGAKVQVRWGDYLKLCRVRRESGALEAGRVACIDWSVTLPLHDGLMVCDPVLSELDP